MEFLNKVADKISKALCLIGGLAVLGMVLLVTYSSISRYVFGVAVSYMEEVAGLFLMVASFSSFAYVFVQKGHVRVTLILFRLPPKIRVIFELAIRFMLLFYMIVFTKLGYGFVVMSYRLDCHTADSGLYEVPWMAVMPVSGFIFALILVISCIQYIKVIFKQGMNGTGSEQDRETIEEMTKAF